MAAGHVAVQARLSAPNRIVAALASGTVVVEAAARGGALSTARHASELARPVMAVPGSATSAMSAGCYNLTRDRRAVCVIGAADITRHLPPVM